MANPKDPKCRREKHCASSLRQAPPTLFPLFAPAFVKKHFFDGSGSPPKPRLKPGSRIICLKRKQIRDIKIIKYFKFKLSLVNLCESSTFWASDHLRSPAFEVPVAQLAQCMAQRHGGAPSRGAPKGSKGSNGGAMAAMAMVGDHRAEFQMGLQKAKHCIAGPDCRCSYRRSIKSRSFLEPNMMHFVFTCSPNKNHTVFIIPGFRFWQASKRFLCPHHQDTGGPAKRIPTSKVDCHYVEISCGVSIKT